MARGHKSLRILLQAVRSGRPIEEAAQLADMDPLVAQMHAAIEDQGGYAEIRVNITRRGDNSDDANRLRVFVERIERLNEEMKGLKEDRKLVLAEAKAEGFDQTGITTIIKLREMDPNDRTEADTIIEMYREAMGID